MWSWNFRLILGFASLFLMLREKKILENKSVVPQLRSGVDTGGENIISLSTSLLAKSLQVIENKNERASLYPFLLYGLLYLSSEKPNKRGSGGLDLPSRKTVCCGTVALERRVPDGKVLDRIWRQIGASWIDVGLYLSFQIHSAFLLMPSPKNQSSLLIKVNVKFLNQLKKSCFCQRIQNIEQPFSLCHILHPGSWFMVTFQREWDVVNYLCLQPSEYTAICWRELRSQPCSRLQTHPRDSVTS